MQFFRRNPRTIVNDPIQDSPLLEESISPTDDSKRATVYTPCEILCRSSADYYDKLEALKELSSTSNVRAIELVLSRISTGDWNCDLTNHREFLHAAAQVFVGTTHIPTLDFFCEVLRKKTQEITAKKYAEEYESNDRLLEVALLALKGTNHIPALNWLCNYLEVEDFRERNAQWAWDALKSSTYPRARTMAERCARTANFRGGRDITDYELRPRAHIRDQAN